MTDTNHPSTPGSSDDGPTIPFGMPQSQGVGERVEEKLVIVDPTEKIKEIKTLTIESYVDPQGIIITLKIYYVHVDKDGGVINYQSLLKHGYDIFAITLEGYFSTKDEHCLCAMCQEEGRGPTHLCKLKDGFEGIKDKNNWLCRQCDYTNHRRSFWRRYTLGIYKPVIY